MVTPEILLYVKNQFTRGASKEIIEAKLRAAGWHEDDILDVMKNAQIEVPPMQAIPSVSSSPVVSTPMTRDPYRESPNDDLMPVMVPKKAPIVAPVAEAIPANDPLVSNTVFVPKVMNTPVSPVSQPTPATSFGMNMGDMPVVNVRSEMQSAQNIMPQGPKSRHVMGWIVCILLLLAVCGGGAYVYTKGYIKLPFEVPFLKQDPREVLMRLPETTVQATAWKSDTEVTISFPSVSHIAGMLMTGEAIDSTDVDTITLNSSNQYSNSATDGVKNILNISGKSSLIGPTITSEVRMIGDTGYVFVPDLSGIIPKTFVIPAGWVTIAATDLREGVSLLPKNVTSNPLLTTNSSGVPAILSLNFPLLLKSFANGMSTVLITEKPDGVVGMTAVYNYSLTIDTPTFKTLAHSLLTQVGVTGDTMELDKIIDATTIKNFEVWIGKNDNRLYKYDIVLEIPLTKVLSLEDKNLSTNMLSIHASTTYHDYDVANSITAPDASSSVVAIVKQIELKEVDLSREEALEAFAISASGMKLKEGSYGVKANTNGSCAAPIAGSLFSPLGHKKQAGDSVGIISQSILRLLGVSDDTATCFSTTTAWAVAVPSATTPGEQLCRDSSGTTKKSVVPLTGTVCK